MSSETSLKIRPFLFLLATAVWHMPLKAVIVGTGIAGLGTAIALKDKGHIVTVVEATSQLQPIGGIITIQANASRILDSWGVYEALLTICAATLFAPCARRYKDGEFLIKRPPELYKNEYGYPYVSSRDENLMIY
jgi:salicylate hydroxylase